MQRNSVHLQGIKYSILFLVISVFLTGCTSVDFDNTPISAGRNPTVRKAILTADDFGASQCINDGIRRGIESGTITSVAAMVTFPDAMESIIALHEQYENIEIGLHLSITSGYPLSSPEDVPSLIQKSGGFYPIDRLIARIDKISLTELECELRLQISKFRTLGIPVSCLSSQHNILGLYSPFLEVVMALAIEYDLPVRSPIPVSVAFKEYYGAKTKDRGAELARNLIKNNIFSAAGFRKYGTYNEMLKNSKKMDSLGIKHPDYLVDSFWGNPSPENLFHLLSNLPEGVSEIVFHPGIYEEKYPVPQGIDENYFLMRELELFCICSTEFDRWLEALNIVKVRFSDL